MQNRHAAVGGSRHHRVSTQLFRQTDRQRTVWGPLTDVNHQPTAEDPLLHRVVPALLDVGVEQPGQHHHVVLHLNREHHHVVLHLNREHHHVVLHLNREHHHVVLHRPPSPSPTSPGPGATLQASDLVLGVEAEGQADGVVGDGVSDDGGWRQRYRGRVGERGRERGGG